MDTGATDHLTNDVGKLQVKQDYTASGSVMPIIHVVNIILPSRSIRKLNIHYVLHVSEFSVSVCKLCM